MASGSFNVSTTHTYVDGRVEWSSTLDKAGNKSSVYAKLILYRTNTGYTTYGTGEFYVTINGTKHTVTKAYSLTSSEQTMVSGTTSVNHNPDGTKSITIAWGGNNDVFNINASSGTAKLDNNNVIGTKMNAWNGSSWVSSKNIYVWTGSAWTSAEQVYVWNGSSWVVAK